MAASRPNRGILSRAGGEAAAKVGSGSAVAVGGGALVAVLIGDGIAMRVAATPVGGAARTAVAKGGSASSVTVDTRPEGDIGDSVGAVGDNSLDDSTSPWP